MRENIVLTLTGPDRVGIVESVTQLLLEYDGNVETSRMARLGGEFAMLMLVSIPQEQRSNIEKGVEKLISGGYKVTTSQTEAGYTDQHADWLPYQIDVRGADHEGIIHQVAHYLTQRGINIESMDTGTVRAPMSGTPLFTMTALVVAPADMSAMNLEDDLAEVGHQLSVDIKVLELQGQPA
jgi:glycine cleavage system transcriptional repressor